MEEIKSQSYSKIVFFEGDDYEAQVIISLFKQLHYEYGINGLSGVKYDYLKDLMKIYQLSKKDYLQLFMGMVNNFIYGKSSK